MPYKVLSLNEVVEYLHISRAAIEKLVRVNDIPFELHGERLVFRKKAIDAWASQRILGFKEKQLVAYHKVSSNEVRRVSQNEAIVPALMQPQFIKTDLASKTMSSVISDMVSLAESTGLIVDARLLKESLLEREGLCSTAMAGGFALLHPRHHDQYLMVDSFVALGRSLQPIPFHAPDGQLTDLFFLICCQDDRMHLHVLARFCMLCQLPSLISELRSLSTPQEILDCLVSAEKSILGNMEH